MIEKLFELIAPDECLICAKEGSCICARCASGCLVAKKPSCVMCNALNDKGVVCTKCRAKTKVSGASIAYRYDGAVKELVGQMKYQNKRSIARYFAAQLPLVELGSQTIVGFVPCDGASRRARGYDQAELLAKCYSRARHLPFRRVLVRAQHKKQVGQKRDDRFKNIKGNFIAKSSLVRGQNILLIDDVITTGATISECARVLKEAGAKRIWAVAIAKK